MAQQAPTALLPVNIVKNLNPNIYQMLLGHQDASSREPQALIVVVAVIPSGIWKIEILKHV